VCSETTPTGTVYVERMADSSNQGFEVAPTRIGGSAEAGRRGRRRVPVFLVVAVAVLVPTIAWIGPNIRWQPDTDRAAVAPSPSPSPTPRETRTPRPGQPTALPAVTLGVGEHPVEPIPIDVNGLRLLDPSTGELGPGTGIRIDEDAVFSASDGDGWWCMCLERREDSGETVAVDIRRVDGDGQTTLTRPVGEYHSSASPPASDYYTRFDLEITPRGHAAYLASATRSGDEWLIAVDAVDLSTGQITGRSVLGSVSVAPIADATPAPDMGYVESYLAGPFIRLSPDGRRLLAWAWADAYSPDGQAVPSSPLAWMIDLEPAAADGSIGAAVPFDAPTAERFRRCPFVAWTSLDELAALCWPSDASTTLASLSVMRSDGSEHRRSIVPGAAAANGWFAEPILDLANGTVLLWQPNDHVLTRVHLDGEPADRLELDPDATLGGPIDSDPGQASAAPGRRPEWTSFGSDFRLWYSPSLLPEPGGSRLFALGMRSDGGRGEYGPASTGIWVLDAGRFELLDRWAAMSSYTGLGLSVDGRWLLAAGMPGVNAEGGSTTWEASLTVFDLVDGRPAVQFGRLGANAYVLQVPN
jgi:hypothetical protein